MVVAEILPSLVSAVQKTDGEFCVNIAHQDHIETTCLDSVELVNPTLPRDRQILIDAISIADEIGTAVPSVNHYVSAGSASLHRILAEGISKKILIGGPRAVIYSAENNNRAAEILKTKVNSLLREHEQSVLDSYVQFLNTVIGKMSQVIKNPEDIESRGLVRITPDLESAFLVEAFNRILISKINFEALFHRGINSFIEKNDLYPFEEAKLYGHNAVHALAGFLGDWLGLAYMKELRLVPGMVSFLNQAFFEESGKALINKYQGIDPLFTAQGFQSYVDDLLERMMNPFLLDTIERVTRDPLRKLGWNDRLIGTMRLALNSGIKPWRFAMGAAAALAIINNRQINPTLLEGLWQSSHVDEQLEGKILHLIGEGWENLPRMEQGNPPDFNSLIL
jgi:mannitol-1-phosphate 5-dehydrogenase